jgi:hypothetical protein
MYLRNLPNFPMAGINSTRVLCRIVCANADTSQDHDREVTAKKDTVAKKEVFVPVSVQITTQSPNGYYAR